jgi:hypothetical protein
MLYDDFNWNLLDDPGFKEDAVREELISPLLTRLGYSASGPCRIHRSKSLKHPFVYLGSKSHRIELIPDYLFEVGGHHRWILDAKAPSENLYEGKNPQQAYSYAIHPDVRTRYFALCNGRNFVIFDIFLLKPILTFPLKNIAQHWKDLVGFVGSEKFSGSIDQLNPDLGLHLHRLGMSHFESMYFVGIAVPMIARISEDNFMISGQYRFGEEVFCASFDFHQSLLSQLTNLLPEPALTLAKQSLYHEPFQVDLRAILPHVTIKCKLGIQIEMTRDRKEEFCPLIVTQFV